MGAASNACGVFWVNAGWKGAECGWCKDGGECRDRSGQRLVMMQWMLSVGNNLKQQAASASKSLANEYSQQCDKHSTGMETATSQVSSSKTG